MCQNGIGGVIKCFENLVMEVTVTGVACEMAEWVKHGNLGCLIRMNEDETVECMNKITGKSIKWIFISNMNQQSKQLLKRQSWQVRE